MLRAQALALAKRDFVLAAKVSGESDLRIIAAEVLPNMLSLLASSFIGATIFISARGVNAGVAGKAFQLPAVLKQLRHPRVTLAHLSQGGLGGQGALQRHALGEGPHAVAEDLLHLRIAFHDHHHALLPGQ